jgi:acyl-CoA thioester hydrolase
MSELESGSTAGAHEPATDAAVFRFWRDVPVRFRDLDPLGHVHHSLSLMYVEEARAAYWREIAGRPDLASIDYVIGSVQVRYHERVLYPQVVRVGLRVARMGGKSLTMEFEIRSPEGALLVSGSVVQVMFDVARGVSFSIPAELRDRISAHEDGAN